MLFIQNWIHGEENPGPRNIDEIDDTCTVYADFNGSFF